MDVTVVQYKEMVIDLAPTSVSLPMGWMVGVIYIHKHINGIPLGFSLSLSSYQGLVKGKIKFRFHLF